MPIVLGEVARILEQARREFRRIDLGARVAVGPHWSHTTTCPTKSGLQLLLRAQTPRSITLRPECLCDSNPAIFFWQSSSFLLSACAEVALVPLYGHNGGHMGDIRVTLLPS